jgi:hypothetical protein
MKTTTTHDEIRRWAGARGAQPATLHRVGSAAEPDRLELEFPGGTHDDCLRSVTWDEWFARFEHQSLAFLYEAEADSSGSTFFRLVVREAW